MVFTKELALKGAGALTAASAASAGLYYALDGDKLCEFDRALIEFLRGGEEGKKNDIVFEVKKGTDDFKATDLTFGSSNSSETVKFTVKASINVTQSATGQVFFTTDSENNTTVADENSLKNIKDLNASEWTWECNIEFLKTGTKTKLKEEHEKTIFSEDKKGLFGILKTKISEQEDAKTDNNKWNKYRKAKVEFIKKCGARRTKETNEEYNKKKGSNSAFTITSSLETLELTARDGNLAPKNPRTFNGLFKKEYWESSK